MDTRDERFVSVHEMTRGTQNKHTGSPSDLKSIVEMTQTVMCEFAKLHGPFGPFQILLRPLFPLGPLGLLGLLNPVSPLDPLVSLSLLSPLD